MIHGTSPDDHNSDWTLRAADTIDTDDMLHYGLWSTTVPIRAFHEAGVALPQPGDDIRILLGWNAVVRGLAVNEQLVFYDPPSAAPQAHQHSADAPEPPFRRAGVRLRRPSWYTGQSTER